MINHNFKKITQLLNSHNSKLECIHTELSSLLNKLNDLQNGLDKFDINLTEYKNSITNKKNLDKFYTNPNIVDVCISQLLTLYKWDNFNLVIEPSAGDGNFYLKIKHSDKIGIDILPGHPDIIEQDFFTFNPPNVKKILTIGNPPFGRVSSLAVKFFNHAAQWSDVIAFIIPKTFRKTSVQNRLNLNFHLVLDNNIPNKPCSFTPKMEVKCCFQIWMRKNVKRQIINLPTSHPDWEFLKLGSKDNNNQPTPPINADFVILAYGGMCGKIQTTNLQILRPKSWHWIKSNIDKKLLIENFSNLNYDNCKNTARQNSMGKSELVQLYNNAYNSIS
jgi:hypothetical protein